MSDRTYQSLYANFEMLPGIGEPHPILENSRARILLEVLIRRRGPIQMAKFFRAYAKRASRSPEGQVTMFGAATSPHEVLADTVREKLGEKWGELQDMSAAIQTLQMAEVRSGAAQFGSIVFQTLDAIGHPRISGDGAYLAFTIERDTDGSEERRLFVMPIEGDDEPLEVAGLVGQHVDWSTDGASVVFTRANVPAPDGNEALRLGALSRRVVRDDSGELLREFADIEDLAGIIFDETLKLRVLPDGRVLFAASEVRLPATAKEMPQRQSLFTVDLNGAATVTRVLPRETESEIAANLGFFEVSPDGMRISVPTDNGRVDVVVLATGEVIHVQPVKDTQDKLRTVPTWRSNDELCFAVPAASEHGSPKRAEIVLWSARGTRTISRSWPDAVVKEFLTLDKDEQQKVGEEMLKPVEP
ncbi:MAG: hypothetical protein IID33_10705 [Planctomycetes bacterium]|nr:hypothetical protein [Planctomycetota bacterium]